MKRVLLWAIGGIVLLVLAGLLAFRLSPWPSALLIQYVFAQGDAASEARLEKHVPPGIIARTDLAYGPDPIETFDIYYPPNATAPLPVIVWVHGGAWIAGSKEGVANYLKVLAGTGVVTVGLNYSVGYGSSYPTPVRQVNAALAYLTAHATELNIDPTQILLAGDSAGAQIAAQLANIITDPAYAAAMAITPTISPTQLRGALLVSGAYDMTNIDLDGSAGWFLRTVLWAYSGVKNFVEDDAFDLASVTRYVTPAFPPSFITSGNGDPLGVQAEALAQRLAALDVPVQSLFFPADHTPSLPHEYQFNLDTQEGQSALAALNSFVASRLNLPH